MTSWLVLNPFEPNRRPRGVDLSDIYGIGTEENRRRAYTWLTRVGASPRFGDRPIVWYQSHQVAARDVLMDRAVSYGVPKPMFFRVRKESFEAYDGKQERWIDLEMSPTMVYDAADRRVREGRV